VDLMEENADAAMVYHLTRGQIVTLGEHVVDISHPAVWQAIDRYKIADPIRCFELVNKVFHHMLKLDRENSE
jgi:hypothetical protein